MATNPRCAVVCYWAPYLMLVLLKGEEIVAFENPRFRRGGVDLARLDRLLTDFILRWCPEKLVVEKRTARYLKCSPSKDLVHTMTVADAKRLLLDGRSTANHMDLYERLIERRPDLAEFIRSRRTGRLSLSGYWPVAKLIPVALGLATHYAASTIH